MLPDAPTLAEAGLPGFDAMSWHMMVAPAKTPKDVVGRLHAEMNSIMALPDIQRQVVRMGLIAVDPPSTGELQRFVATEIDRWGKMCSKRGWQPRNTRERRTDIARRCGCSAATRSLSHSAFAVDVRQLSTPLWLQTRYLTSRTSIWVRSSISLWLRSRRPFSPLPMRDGRAGA
jgi:hypothetical protein